MFLSNQWSVGSAVILCVLLVFYISGAGFPYIKPPPVSALKMQRCPKMFLFGSKNSCRECCIREASQSLLNRRCCSFPFNNDHFHSPSKKMSVPIFTEEPLALVNWKPAFVPRSKNFSLKFWNSGHDWSFNTPSAVMGSKISLVWNL